MKQLEAQRSQREVWMNGAQQRPLDISSDARAVMSMYLGGSMETRVIVSRNVARSSGIYYLSTEEWEGKFIYI